MNDEAVSTVLGAILVLGFVVAAMAVYQLNVVPNLVEESEARHAGAAEAEMSQVTADVLRQLDAASKAPMSSPVTLEREGPTLASGGGGSSALSFEPGTDAVELASPNLNLVTRDGEPLLGQGNASGSDWREVQNGETIEDVDDVVGLRIKITEESPDDNDSVEIRATDADGDYAGDLQAIVEINPPDLDLVVQTREPPEPGSTLFHNHVLSIHRERWDSDYWLDAMLDLYWFDMLVEDAEKPVTLTFLDGGLEAEYRVSYSKRTDAGPTTLVGAGREIPDYENSYETGHLVHDAQNQYYPDQELSIEHGALVRSQSDGSAFAIDPPLRVQAGSEVVRLDLDVPSLDGISDTASGGVASVRTSAEDTDSLGALAGELDLTFGTEHPDLWAEFLDDEMSEAGLTSTGCPPASPDSPCQYEVTTEAQATRLEVHGPHAFDADPDDPERDIFVNVQRGLIETEVQT